MSGPAAHAAAAQGPSAHEPVAHAFAADATAADATAADASAAPDAPRTPPKIPRPEPAPRAVSPAVAALEADVAAFGLVIGDHTAELAALAERFWRVTAARTPLIEPVAHDPAARVVTFLWRDADAADVLLFANRITDERDLAASLMDRVPGTDVWHLSYRMRSSWRASYGFVRRAPDAAWPWPEGDQLAIRQGLDRCAADPGNPDGCRNRAGIRQSVVALPDAPRQDWLAPREHVAGRGCVTEHVGPDRRTVWVYEPPLPSDDDEPLPVVVLLDGEVWTGSQDVATTVDNLIDDGLIRPCVVVMPEAGDRSRRWAELDAAGGGTDWIVDRLLPWARANCPISDDPADVVVAGQSLGGYTALRTVLERPDGVGAALSQSASLWQRDLDGVLAGADGTGVRVYLEVGGQEWMLCEPNRRFAAHLAAAGADVRYVEYDGGHDYACWRGGIADGLRVLLAPTR